jgi:hypothetical protein
MSKSSGETARKPLHGLCAVSPDEYLGGDLLRSEDPAEELSDAAEEA